jgi:hypothetical protein
MTIDKVINRCKNCNKVIKKYYFNYCSGKCARESERKKQLEKQNKYKDEKFLAKDVFIKEC